MDEEIRKLKNDKEIILHNYNTAVKAIEGLKEKMKDIELRAYERVRAELIATAMTAGEQTGYCDTCSGFDMTGWDASTINEIIDGLKRSVVAGTTGV